jgi:hypothetical protein
MSIYIHPRLNAVKVHNTTTLTDNYYALYVESSAVVHRKHVHIVTSVKPDYERTSNDFVDAFELLLPLNG